MQSLNKLLLKKIIHGIIERDKEEWPPTSFGVYFQLKRPENNPVCEKNRVIDNTTLKNN